MKDKWDNNQPKIQTILFRLLTGKFFFTSHNRSVLSVDADASSSLDKNFTYETAFLCPLKTWTGRLVFLKS